jgi:Gnt-I system high-affinity gluconate transporter/Gnt-II system L-idonate transporter
MALIVLAVAVVILLILIGLKVDAFIALLITSFITGILNRMPPDAALKSLLKGFGDTVGSLGLIILFGAMLGRLIEESGAAHTIAGALTRLLGRNRVQLSVLITSFLVGLAMFFQPAFFILIPLIYTLSTTTGLPLMYLAIPFCAALSVTHGYLPPHPGVTAVAVMLHADVNRTLLYGLIIAIPAMLIAGPPLSILFRRLPSRPPARFFHERTFTAGTLPGLMVSLTAVLFPVLIMLAGAAVTLTANGESALTASVRFVSEPNVVLFLAVLLGFYTLGLRRGRSLETLMKEGSDAIGGVAPSLFVIAAGGAFKQVLLDGGTGEAVRQMATQIHVSPIVLAWGAAALLRAAVGSATVAAITAAGIVLPMVPVSGVRPELLVLAIGAGSITFSHFSDSGFWIFKEYFGLSVRQTLATWTVMEIVIGVAGLAGVLLLNLLR